MLISNSDLIGKVRSMLYASKDMLTILAEGLFIGCFYSCLEIAGKLRPEPLSED